MARINSWDGNAGKGGSFSALKSLVTLALVLILWKGLLLLCDTQELDDKALSLETSKDSSIKIRRICSSETVTDWRDANNLETR